MPLPSLGCAADGKAHFEIDFVGQRIFWLQGRGRPIEAGGARPESEVAQPTPQRAEVEGEEIPF